LEKAKELSLKGTILLSLEGINFFLAGSAKDINSFVNYLRTDPKLSDVRPKESWSEAQPFKKMLVKIKREIIRMNHPTIKPENARAPSVSASQLQAWLQSGKDDEGREVVTLDTRNDYEVLDGRFKDAIEYNIGHFGEFPEKAKQNIASLQNKTVVSYCTGGIRCEKASAYMLHQGFKNVFHLEGGIINYANKIKEAGIESKFKGKNFVFDDRLGEKITEDIISKCHQCGAPCDTHTNCKNDGCHLLFIQCPSCAETYAGCCTQACTDIVHLPEEKQIELRKGIDKGQQIFNKSKQRLRPRLGIDI
jgi:UPF0176 protein